MKRVRMLLSLLLLLPGCGGSGDPSEETERGGEAEIVEEEASVEEIVHFLNDRKAREARIEFSDLEDPFFPKGRKVLAVSASSRAAPVSSRKETKPPIFRLEGISHVKGAGRALINGKGYSAGDQVGGGRLDHVGRRRVTFSRGNTRFVVAVGERLPR